MESLEWLQEWYLQNCDGDWEHCYGVKIGTLDNPGWSIDIDLVDTKFEDEIFEKIVFQRNETDWVHCQIVNGIFKGRGGPKNLKEIIQIFQVWWFEKSENDESQ